MTDRIIEISDSPAHLKYRTKLLVIERKGLSEVTMPVCDVATLILSHPQITCTHAILSGLMEGGAAMITCDDQHIPIGMMLPIQSHSTQTERFIAQASASLPLKKRAWKHVIKAKIVAQASLADELAGASTGLREYVSRVRSGDPDNLEAQVAARYWPMIFDDPNFRRRREAEDANRLLNYGYAVLRAIIGRAICGVGLHPSLGIHHHNRYNAYCLADDLMEPFRPIVDATVVEHVATFGHDAPLDRNAKATLIGSLMARYRAEGEVRSFFDWAARTASSLAKVFLGQSKNIDFPRGLERAED